MNVKLINCEEAILRLNDFIDNYLNGESKKELIRHIKMCRHCFERFEFEQILKSKISKIAKDSKNQFLVRKIEKMFASIE